MRPILFETIVTLVVVFAGLAYTCSIDDGQLYFAGGSRVLNGRLFYEYKCYYNSKHVYWIRADQQ